MIAKHTNLVLCWYFRMGSCFRRGSLKMKEDILQNGITSRYKIKCYRIHEFDCLFDIAPLSTREGRGSPHCISTPWGAYMTTFSCGVENHFYHFCPVWACILLHDTFLHNTWQKYGTNLTFLAFCFHRCLSVHGRKERRGSVHESFDPSLPIQVDCIVKKWHRGVLKCFNEKI